ARLGFLLSGFCFWLDFIFAFVTRTGIPSPEDALVSPWRTLPAWQCRLLQLHGRRSFTLQTLGAQHRSPFPDRALMVLIFTHRRGFIFEGLFICHLKSFWLGTAGTPRHRSG
ncbi:MAG: hypothetical protein AB7U62_01580, partial [Pseudolabrys sp.]